MRTRRCASLALSFVLILAGSGRADDQARAIVDKGIKAAGGADKIAKFKALALKMKGTFHGMGAPIPYTGEWTVDLPDRMRMQLDFEANGMKFMFVRVYNRGKGWQKIADTTQELEKDQLAEAREEMHAGWVGSLLPLTDKAFTLAPLGEIQIDRRPAVGVRVSHKGHRDINLYFDKESGLLVKTETRVRDDQSGMEVGQEEFYSDFKEIDGVKHPMKLTIKREGKLYVEGETTELKAVEKPDDSSFNKP
jgi:hypothetical protein